MRKPRPVIVNGYEILDINCRSCGTDLKVVRNSVPDRERLCNRCAISEAYHFLYGDKDK